MALPLSVAHFYLEPATSLLERLAEANACPTASVFCSEMALSLPGVRSGRPDAIGQLSSLAGVCPAALQSWSVKREKSRITLRGVNFNTQNLNRSSRKMCPECVLDDLGVGEIPAKRVIWKLSALNCCPTHLRALVEVPTDIRIVDRLEMRSWAREAVGTAPERALTPYETYLLHRVVSGPIGDWMDQLNVGSIEQFCGAYSKIVVDLSQNPSERSAAFDRAFSAMTAGPVALRDTLLDLLPHYGGYQRGYHGTYRPFLDWMRTASDAEGASLIRQVIMNVVYENCAVHPSSKLFMKDARQNNLQKSYHQMRGIVDVGGRQLGQFLVDRQLAIKGRAAFDYKPIRYLSVSEGLAADREMQGFATVKLAGAKLVLSVDATRKLISSHVIPVITAAGPRRGLANRSFCDFLAAELATRGCHGSVRVPSRYVPLRNALNRRTHTLAELVSLVVAGGIRYRFDGDAGSLISSIQIDGELNVDMQLQGLDMVKSWDDVCKFLAMDRQSLRFYAQQGHLSQNPDATRVGITDLPALIFFHRAYVSERSLLRSNPDKEGLISKLTQAGITPLIAPTGVDRLYRTAEVRQHARAAVRWGNVTGRRAAMDHFLRGNKWDRLRRARGMTATPAA